MTPSIAIITATYNAAGKLPGLIASLRAQSDKSFEFIVIDGASNDGTREIIEAAADVVTVFLSEPDYGIYDALNKAIRLAASEYYIVAGADDTFATGAVAIYRGAARMTRADILVAGVMVGENIRRGYHPKRAWLGHPSMVSSHSIGMMFRAELHQKFGEYSLRYPLLADGYFIKQACKAPGVIIVEVDFIAGRFGLDGQSNSNLEASLCELWQIQVATNESRCVQLLLFIARLLLHAPTLLSSKK